MITITAKITISPTEIIEINHTNIISFDSTTYDRADLKLPSFGIISNSGNIEFNDIAARDENGKFLYYKVADYAEKLLLKEGLECDAMLINTLNEKSERLALLITDQWNYNSQNHSVIVSLKDDLEEWQNINVEGISYDPTVYVPKNLLYFYDYLYEKTPKKYNMLRKNELDSATYSILSINFVEYPLLESGNLWQQWTKLCQVAQAHIYKDDGVTRFRYNGGN